MRTQSNLVKTNFKIYALLFSFISLQNKAAEAQEFITDDGYPCNVFLNQPGVDDAAGNYADFIVNPNLPSQVTSFIAGEIAEYLTGGYSGKKVADLAILKPIGFYLTSAQIGAKFGVDVCIPPISGTSSDVLDWNVTVTPSVALNPPPDDWFTQTNPKISIAMHASNCGTAAGSPLSPGSSGSCNVFGTTSVNLQLPTPTTSTPQFNFKLVANREAVLRFTVEEQPGITPRFRRNDLDAGKIKIEFGAPPPPLTVDDLNKLLSFSPDPAFAECFPPSPTNQNRLDNFHDFVYFDGLKLQGPNDGTRLDWLAQDIDATSPIPGNNSNPVNLPVNIVYQAGTNNVLSFERIYVDNDTSEPRNGQIRYDYTIDKVFRDLSNNVFVSATVSRNASGVVHQCRVWFKRSSGLRCNELPDIPVPTNPIVPYPPNPSSGTLISPPVYSSLRSFCSSF
ncbi:MAG: hypothetical protein RL189_2284 [Pseudomonadota bacterium]|jgi:hypothetical protein